MESYNNLTECEKVKYLLEILSPELILPQLAKDFKKEESKVRYPCFVQPKLDGMRCLKNGSSMVSRKNKSIDTMGHISQELQDISDILDGELYTEETFQRNMELIKKYRPGESEQVRYHVYDLVDTELSFGERYEKLRELIHNHQPQNIVIVPTYEINSKEELLEYHAKFLAEGYEGTMIRLNSGGYDVNKRSSNLLKYKDFQDIACTITGVEPSEKRPDQGSFICALEDGRTFGCGMRFSHEERKDVINNPQNYIGQTAEIRFFEYTDDQLPRFPVCVGLRLDK